MVLPERIVKARPLVDVPRCPESHHVDHVGSHGSRTLQVGNAWALPDLELFLAEGSNDLERAIDDGDVPVEHVSQGLGVRDCGQFLAVLHATEVAMEPSRLRGCPLRG